MAIPTNKFHADGTVTYWSLYRQQWTEHANPAEISDRDLATMSHAEVDQIVALAQRNAGSIVQS